QANVWSEYIPTSEHAEYMTMPRMAAMAEVLWSAKEGRSWAGFAPRVELEMKRYSEFGYNYANSAYLVNIMTTLDTVTKGIAVALRSELDSAGVRYTLDGSTPTTASMQYAHPFAVASTSTIRAGDFRNGELMDSISARTIIVHKAVGKRVELKYPYEEYNGGGAYALTNGVLGSASYNDGNWQGFHQNDLEATIDLGKSMPLTKISTRYMENTPDWIFLPTSVEYFTSEDGKNFVSAGSFAIPVPAEQQPVNIKEYPQTLQNISARYIRVVAKNIGIVPQWHIGRGDKAWLFIDEIVVE
ncbi:MAG TPA: chitobiase/beta-hexosaminidase C-terminal domain-containing protein, partial [Bacteroidota bacterium]|nr:chitobiase/beta-hexosaminidase C-terminal domain-containing protein [Bacteroidota bacterium]